MTRLRPRETNSPGAPPWYESGLFWGCASLAFAVVFFVSPNLAAELRKLLLFFAWVMAGIAWWRICTKLKSKVFRRVVFTLLVAGTGLGLLRLRPQPISLPLLISTYKIPSFDVGQPVTVALYFRNTSDDTVRARLSSAVGVAAATEDLKEVERTGNLTFDAAKSAAQSVENVPEIEIPPHATMHVNLPGKEMTEDQRSGLIAGTHAIYFAGFFDYKVDGVSHETPFCGFTTKRHEIPNCLEHNQPF